MGLNVDIDFTVPEFVANIDLFGASVDVNISQQDPIISALVEIGTPGNDGDPGLGLSIQDKQSSFNKFRHAGVGIAYSGSTLLTTAGRLIAYIVRLPSHGRPITQLQIQVGTAGSPGIEMLAGIYSMGDDGDLGGRNENLIASCKFDLATTGVKQSTLSVPILGDGQLVVLAAHTNGAASVRGFGTANHFMTIIQDSIYNNFGDIAKYANNQILAALPETLPALPTATASSSMPFIAFGVS